MCTRPTTTSGLLTTGAAMSRIAKTFPRNIDWNLFKTFHEIAEAGGISRASAALLRKQSSISLALQRMETQLGVTLCSRGPRGFQLTEEGIALAELCRSLNGLVAQVPTVIETAETEVAGAVTIQIISGLVCERLDKAIARFHDRHPKAEIQIDIMTWDTVPSAVLRHETDIGVAPSAHPRGDLRYDFLFEEHHRPYCGRTHALYGRSFEDVWDLARHAFILTGADEPLLLKHFRERFGLGQVVAGLSEHLDEAKRLTMLGIGICFLPEGFAAPDVETGRLWPLLADGREPSMPVYIITNPSAPQKLARQLLLSELSAAGDTRD